MRKIAVTGHRPDKLGWGYNYNDPRWIRLKEVFKQIIIDEINDDIENGGDGIIELIEGAALGVDTVYGIAAIELKSEGYKIKLVVAVPFHGQESRWPKESQDIYKNILGHADEVVYVSKGSYAAWKMQKRNEYMVDRADKLIAVYDETLKGTGTGNCVSYARKKNRDIVYINPNAFE